MRFLREADPAAYQRATAVLASKAAPPGMQRALVLSAIVEAADDQRSVPHDRSALAARTALPLAHVTNALLKLIGTGWIKIAGDRLVLQPRAFGETGAAT